MLDDVLRKWGAVEVSAMDVYSDVFRLGEGKIQRYNGSSGDMKSNPLGYWKQNDSETGHYRILFEDTFTETLKELQEADFAILNGLTYFGRRNTVAAANRMFAMIFDLDNVGDKELSNFLYAAIDGIQYRHYPIPNYIAMSGHGIHLYYVFDQPIPLYPNIKLQLKEFKYALIDRMWNKYTTGDLGEHPQYQGINQGFRVIGGKTKIPGVRVRAFRLSRQRITLQQMGGYVPPEHKIDELKLWTESRMTLKDAQKKYPEWYSAVVEGKEKRDGHWVCKRELYDWWLQRIRHEAKYHHRYFCVMCMAIYAVKSGISREELERDCKALIPFMNTIAPDPFTETDVESALECFEERYARFPIDDIVKLTQIMIQKNRRNGRKQNVHLGRIRALQQYDDPEGEWRNKDGRPTKETVVRAWRANNPDGSVTMAARELGLSRTTVYKYWD